MNKNLHYTALLVLLLFLVTPLKGKGENCIDIAVLPSPKEVEIYKGTGLKPDDITCLQKPSTVDIVLGRELESLPYQCSRKGIKITFGIVQKNASFSHREGYTLSIHPDKIEIFALTTEGLFYGAQTLHQLLEDAKEQKRNIPYCKITDYPDIDFRAVHLDLKHHLDHVSYYYDYIDRLAKYKINGIIVEFEDKLRYEQVPVVGATQSISIDEWIAISDYAQKRNIEISPLVQGLGHADFILKHNEFAAIREDKNSDWTCCPSNPKTYDMQFALYKDAIRATPNGRYVHIGGDEVGGLGQCPLCKMRGKSAFELQMDWLTKVCEFIKQQGRSPIFWDDMVFKSVGSYKSTYDPNLPEKDAIAMWNQGEQKLATAIQRFPKECIYMRWNYETPGLAGNIKALDWYARSGLTVMAATAAQCTENLMPRHHGRVAYIKEFSELTKQRALAGILCTAWDDASPHIETHWRGYIAQAEYGWRTNKRTVAEFNKVYRQREFGHTASMFAFQDRLGDAMAFWEQALLDEGVRIHMWENHGAFKHIAIPDPDDCGAWSVRYQKRIRQAEKELFRYQQIKNEIANMKAVAVRNRYTLDFFNAINEYQVFTSKLLMALHHFDEQPTATNKQMLKNLMDSYKHLKTNLENQYSQTRHIHKGGDYLLSQNHHSHNANRSVNSDWIFMFESIYVDQLNKLITQK